MQRSKSVPFAGVSEVADSFLALFPHRFDYIWSPHPHPHEPPAWQTESRHPLSDRLIQQGAYLYGVRFGPETRYCLLDVDRDSPYHPRQDPFAIARLVAALEPLGLVSYVACTSSYSHGLHLYLPFQQAQSSWKLAIAVTTLIENAGFRLKPGQLEVFPDPKPYNVSGKLSLFNAHRLPLQMGSYLVDAEFQPSWSTPQHFVQQWQFAQARNEVESRTIRRILKQAKRQRYTVSTKAEKFINDLNAEIEFGWTGFGQTNRLLGRITMRAYIFNHVLVGGPPLKGSALVKAIVSVARSLPGYREYCRHRHEIEQRAVEWASCIENSHYFHYGDAAGKFKAKDTEAEPGCAALVTAIDQAPSWNQQQSASARERIRRAIAHLLEQADLPANATARFHKLVSYGIGGGTLYHHRDLWHPNHLVLNLEADANASSDNQSVEHQAMLIPVENPPHPPTAKQNREEDRCEAASPSTSSVSLFPLPGRNPLPDLGSSDPERSVRGQGRNFPALPDFVQRATLPVPTQGPAGTNASHADQRSPLEQAAAQAAQQAALQMTKEQRQQLKQQAAESRQIARMQQYLDSQDPILMAEAIAWAKVNPGILDTR